MCILNQCHGRVKALHFVQYFIEWKFDKVGLSSNKTVVIVSYLSPLFGQHNSFIENSKVSKSDMYI